MLYLAYGSNMNVAHMAVRCPTAKVVGDTVLEGYQLLFRGRNGGAYATIEENPEFGVPVIVWELDGLAEKRLDRYEGFPTLYRKEFIQVELAGKTVQAMIYIMNEDWPIGMPNRHYYEGILEAYEEAGLDVAILDEAVRLSARYDINEFLHQERCSRCGGPLATRTMSRMNEDVLCMDCAEAEKGHPRYQEAVDAEIEQVKAGNYNYPGLFAGKRYPF